MGSSVSVIIPCYNYGEFLPACVASVLSQSGVDVEVLIVDDCSSDDTLRVGTALASDPRVTFRRHDCNLRHIATYNEGMAWATGTYTLLLSADDLLLPNALARATEVLDSDSRIGMVYGHAPYFQFNAALPATRTGRGRPQFWDGSDWIARRCRTATNCISSPEVVLRTSLSKELGGYRPDLPHTADLEMWLRVAAHSNVAYLMGVDQALYRVHPKSMLRTTFNAPLTDLRQRKAAFDAVFEGHGRFIRNAASLHARANRALARDALWCACRAFDRRRLGELSVDELEEFARDTCHNLKFVSEYWALGWRRWLGPRWCPKVQALMPDVAAHHVRTKLWWRRQRTCGV